MTIQIQGEYIFLVTIIRLRERNLQYLNIRNMLTGGSKIKVTIHDTQELMKEEAMRGKYSQAGTLKLIADATELNR